jgi:mono/diheme cytochrome c family protein
MIARLQIGLAAGVGLALLLAGCSSRLPGQPTEAERWRAPNEVTDFNQLYTQNCAGCHGVGGKLGAARPLNDPLYLAFVTDDAMREAISKGRGGTNMPAFSAQAGGHLTDQQIELIVTGMRVHWSKPEDFKGVQFPSYSAMRRARRDSIPRRVQRVRPRPVTHQGAPQLTKPIVRVVTEQMAMADLRARSLIRIF